MEAVSKISKVNTFIHFYIFVPSGRSLEREDGCEYDAELHRNHHRDCGKFAE